MKLKLDNRGYTPLKTWGAWRTYNGNLINEDGGISLELLSEILEKVGFKSAKELNDELNKYERGEIPVEIQTRLKKLFLGHGDKPTPDIPEKFYVNEVSIKNPFTLAEEPSPFEVQIYSMNIEENESDADIYVRAGVSCERLYQPISKEMEALCAVLIKTVSSEEFSSEDISLIAKYLEENGNDPALAKDEDFRGYLGDSIRDLAEGIGIYVEEDGGFYLEDDELGFN